MSNRSRVQIGFTADEVYQSLVELPGGKEAVSVYADQVRFQVIKDKLHDTPGDWIMIINGMGKVTAQLPNPNSNTFIKPNHND